MSGRRLLPPEGSNAPAEPREPREPRPRTPGELERLEERLHGESQRVYRKLCRLLELVEERATTPATPRTVVLTATTPRVQDNVGERQASRSIGLLNPTDAEVFIGLGGGAATAAARAVSAPPRSLIVLPISAQDVELGASDFSAGDVVVHLLRFELVQPAFLGSIS